MPDIYSAADLPDLAYPYALDALSETDARAVEHLLDHADEDSAADFRATVRDLRETLAAMTAVDAVPAPPSVEEALLRALEAQDGPADSTDRANGFAAAESPQRLGRRWLALAAAVAVVVGVAAGITVYRNQSGPGAITAEQVRTHSDTQQRTVPVTGGGTITVDVSRELGAAIVSFDAVPPPPADHTYQLWLISGADKVDSAGVLSTLPTSRAPMLMRFGDAGQLAVSVEPEGGSVAPTTDPVVGVPLT
ncbi:anti-sigma factor [Nocardia sp. NPDC051832]|uniref:anti-sigma factor n=1 Tax=Nocardia sp. NPDC051832 TaxID=3155673 RepID=UPI00343400B7